MRAFFGPKVLFSCWCQWKETYFEICIHSACFCFYFIICRKFLFFQALNSHLTCIKCYFHLKCTFLSMFIYITKAFFCFFFNWRKERNDTFLVKYKFSYFQSQISKVLMLNVRGWEGSGKLRRHIMSVIL